MLLTTQTWRSAFYPRVILHVLTNSNIVQHHPSTRNATNHSNLAQRLLPTRNTTNSNIVQHHLSTRNATNHSNFAQRLLSTRDATNHSNFAQRLLSTRNATNHSNFAQRLLSTRNATNHSNFAQRLLSTRNATKHANFAQRLLSTRNATKHANFAQRLLSTRNATKHANFAQRLFYPREMPLTTQTMDINRISFIFSRSNAPNLFSFIIWVVYLRALRAALMAEWSNALRIDSSALRLSPLVTSNAEIPIKVCDKVASDLK